MILNTINPKDAQLIPDDPKHRKEITTIVGRRIRISTFSKPNSCDNNRDYPITA